MKPKITYISWLVLLWPLLATAGSKTAIFELQQKIEDRVRPIVKAIDPEAVVFVRLVRKTAETELPSTPFTLKNMTLDEQVEDVELSKVDVFVLTNKTNLPASVMSLIRELAVGLGPVPVVRLRPLPEGLVVKAPETENKPLTLTQKLRQFGQLHGWFYPLVGGGLVLLTVAFTFSLIFLRVGSLLKRTMETGSDKLANAMEQSGGNSVLSPSTPIATSMPTLSAGEPPVHSQWADYPLEGLIALLADCYWGEMDSYAAYLWKRIPVSRKKELLGKLDYLASYTSLLKDVPELDLGEGNSAYYLNPLPVAHLNNQAVTEQVKKFPALLKKLPPLRLGGLKLTARERLELMKQAVSNSKVTIDFGSLAASSARLIKEPVVVPLKTVQEEAEILNLKDISVELKSNIKTLGWLRDLSPEKLTDIFSRYSAKELASAWIGPEEVLSHFAQYLPEKKRELLQSYRSKIPASRENQTFRELHRTAINELSVVSKPELRRAA